MNNIQEIKRKIINNSIYCDREDLIAILNFLKSEHINSKLFVQNSDGIRINLDAISENIILKLHTFIEYRTKNKN